MESESIVDYLKSSLGKPWPLIASSDLNFIEITTTQTTALSTLGNHKTISHKTSNNNTDSQLITNGKSYITEPPNFPSPTTPSSSPNPAPPPPSPPLPSLNSLPPTPQSPSSILTNNHINNNCYDNMNNSATQLDGLYPEWDEFYLLVCDICSIVIRPQALEKHLATKHRINLQTSNNQSPLPNNHKTSTAVPPASINTINSTTIPNNHHHTNNNNDSLNSQNHQPLPTTNGFSDPTSYGLEPLSPTPTSSSTTSPSSSSSTSSYITMSPSLSTPSKYQDRKWRNTFNVLKDAFF